MCFGFGQPPRAKRGSVRAADALVVAGFPKAAAVLAAAAGDPAPQPDSASVPVQPETSLAPQANNAALEREQSAPGFKRAEPETSGLPLASTSGTQSELQYFTPANSVQADASGGKPETTVVSVTSH